MVSRRALVLDDDDVVSELPIGDELAGGGSAAVPTFVNADTTYNVQENTQALFRKRIRLGPGARIKLDGILVEV